MEFPFGPWAPDLGENSPGILMQATGAVPLDEGYGPFPALVQATSATALSGAPRGAFSYQTNDGAWRLVAGTATTIETMASDFTWSSIDTGLTPTAGDDFCFERYGDYLLYTDTTDGMRQYDVETGGAASAVAAAGSPRWIFECGNILFALDCLNRAGDRDNKLIRSCKRGDHTAWTGIGTDYQPLQTGGALIWGGKLSDTSALILQQREVRLLQVGNVGSAKWGLQSVSKEFGAVGAKSVVAFDGAVYWLATDGWRRFSLGGGLERIGAGLVDQTFLADLDQSDMSLVQGTIDPIRKCVLWRYKSRSCSSTEVFDDIIGYYWPKGRWFRLSVQTSALAFGSEAAITWDSFSGTWDGADVAWDSRALSGGQPLLGAFNDDFVFGYFAGGSMAATLETSIAHSGASGLINWADPVDDAAGGTLELGVKNSLSDTTTWKTGAAKVASGRVPLRGRGKNIGFRRNIAASETWTYARGVDHVVASGGGVR